MTDLEALHRAILQYPDDDTPRLLYADALEEAGESERAAFIRGQVAADRVPNYDPVAIQFRLHDLPELGGWPLDTLPELPPGLNWTEQPFRRGFPSAIEAGDGSAFVAHHAELFDIAPVEELQLMAIPLTEFQPLVNCPGLARISKLVLVDGAIGLTAERLLASAHLSRLSDFHFGSRMSTGGTDVAVVRSPAFARLRAFGCRNVRWPDQFFEEVRQLEHQPHLTKLDLAGNSLAMTVRPPDYDLRRNQFADFLREPIANHIEELDLSENNLGPAGIEELSSLWLEHLTTLSIRQTRPEEEGLRAFLTGIIAPDLHSLNLGGNNLSATLGELLAASAALEELRVLDLSENRLGDAGAMALARSPHLANLLFLDVRDNDLGAASQAVLRERFGERVAC